jgi:hypothetical protein
MSSPKAFRQLRAKVGCCPYCAQLLPTFDEEVIYNKKRAFVARNGSYLFLSELHNGLFSALIRSYPESTARAVLEMAAWGEELDNPRALNTQLCLMRKGLRLLGIDVLNNHGEGWYLVLGEMPAEGFAGSSTQWLRRDAKNTRATGEPDRAGGAKTPSHCRRVA